MSPWIKIEHTTPDKPEVVTIATTLGIDPDAVVGKLVRLWIWADQNCCTGNNVRVTAAFLDRITYQPGFAAALREAGWLTGEDGNLVFMGFDRHNGTSSKARAETNRRVARHRNKKAVTDVTEGVLQKPLPEEEEEEEVTTTTTTTRAPVLNRGCSLDEARDYATTFNAGKGQASGLRIAMPVVTLWHNEREKVGWITVKGQLEIPIANWQADLESFAQRYAQNEQQGGQSRYPTAAPRNPVKLTTEKKGGW